MTGQAPLLAVADGVARITLRRPRQANRLTVDDLATLRWRTAGGQAAPVIVRTRGHRLEGV